MPWNTPSLNDVLAEFTPQEQTALNLLHGSTQPLPAILQRTIAAARGSILAGGNELDAEGTVPDQVLPHILAVTRWRWLTSFPTLKPLQTEPRKAAYEYGLQALDQIAAGRPKVERPLTPITTTGNLITSPSIRPRPLQFQRQNQDGI